MSQRTCDVTGCSNKHRARGLCSTHYNRTRYPDEQRHPKHSVPCVVCGTTVRRGDPSRYRPTCSVACRRTVTWGDIGPSDGYSWALDAADRARSRGCAVVEVFERSEVFDRDAWLCRACGVHCTEPDPFVLTAATVDHVVPHSRGGEHSLANTQTLCLSCNSAKQDNVAA